jgi:hypothetical protein
MVLGLKVACQKSVGLRASFEGGSAVVAQWRIGLLNSSILDRTGILATEVLLQSNLHLNGALS